MTYFTGIDVSLQGSSKSIAGAGVTSCRQQTSEAASNGGSNPDTDATSASCHQQKPVKRSEDAGSGAERLRQRDAARATC